jgi:hypothetical protein
MQLHEGDAEETWVDVQKIVMWNVGCSTTEFMLVRQTCRDARRAFDVTSDLAPMLARSSERRRPAASTL